jgi:Fe-S oxidoreductase
MMQQTLFTLILLTSLGLFTWLAWRRLVLIDLGRPENRFDRPLVRLRGVLTDAIGQRRVIRRPFGLNHLVIFWSFLVLTLANGEFLLQGVFPDFSLGLLFPSPLHHGLLLAFDLVSLLALVAVAMAAGRRLLVRPAQLDSTHVSGRSRDAFIILGAIGLLMVAYFGLHASEIALGHSNGAWQPVSSAVAGVLSSLPRPALIEPLAVFFWWLHAAVLLAFLCYLPASKHLHVLTAIPNCFFRSLDQGAVPAREEIAEGNSYGVAEVSDFSWKDLLDSFSCTECGRCQAACPAHATGKHLNPRQVIHAIKTNLLANGALLMGRMKPTVPLIGPAGEATLDDEALWACTTCGACMANCPVCIEQMPKIISLRRNLVQMESRFPEELLNFFENVENRANPWGIAPVERTKWTATLEARPFKAGETEYLFFVGCAGAFDSRNKQVTQAVARILDAAGVSWGILGRDEKCCGDSLRRLGNEYVFDRLARENVQTLQERGVTKIITHCPHCFTVLKNDYRQYGLELEVVHHSELIRDLLASGRLVPGRQVVDLGTTVLHDSCYLGRHNGIYAAPRQVIAQTTGTPPVEMARNLQNGFCCGAGGGRMWQEEQTGTRINLARVAEALESSADTICVSCPYCLTMFEDGLKDSGNDTVKVKDLAELVAAGLPSEQA